MISATALNASTVPLNKSPQMPLGLDNSRLRVDSQKFLVPSLPVSSRPINPRVDPHHSHPLQHTTPHHLHYQQAHNAGGGSSDVVNKRRERSILNGTAHPIHPPESSRLGAGGMSVHALNGLRRSTSPLGGKGTSPNYSHMQGSPRKDAHSPMYAGEVPGFNGSPGSNFSARSSVPIPCSSPSPGASASPKSSVSHSHSPNSNGGGSGSGNSFPPHFPQSLNPGANGTSELTQIAMAAAAAAAASGARLYPPGFPTPPSAAAAHHAAFYAVAAAAAGHSLPYPLFGSHFPAHQNSAAAAAASSYLDFHSKFLRNSAAAVAPELRSPSQSPPSRSYHQALSPQQQQTPPQPPPHMLQPLASPQSTSVTSLHTKLIESVAATGDRFHPHHTGHNHIHSSGNSNQQQHGTNGHHRFSSGSSGVSKGGPLGISGGIMGLSISPNSNSPHKGHAGPSATSATPEMSSKSVKLYMEHPGLPGNNNSGQQERKLLAEMELINGNKTKESMMSKQRMMTRSPDEYSSRHHHNLHSQHLHREQPSQKMNKSISYAGDIHSGGLHRSSNHPYMNGQPSHHQLHSQHTQGHHHHLSNSSSSGPTNLSTDCKRANSGSANHNNVSSASQQHHMFLPPSPKKRSAPWNFAVPQSPGSGSKMGDLLPPPPPPSDSMSDPSSSMLHLSPSKYLNQSHQHQKPSNGGPGSSLMTNIGGSGTGLVTGTHYQSSNAQQLLVVPSSPLSSSSSSSHGGSGPSTPKSPSVHFKFFGASTNNKENSGIATTGLGSSRTFNARNDSSSSTSSIEFGVINGNTRNRQNNGPLPVEQMPLISAFRRGSMIKLASGDMKAVEDLKEEDFEKAAQMMADSVKIVYCHVISIHTSPIDSSLCKVTLALGATQNQQVAVESSPEQPFYVRGRGWSSSSPKQTEKLLQLPCSTLAVGDVCITLTRHVRSQSNSTSSRGQTNYQSRGSKTKSGVTRPYGTYAKSRNSSTSSILKSSHQIQRSNNSGAMRMNGRKLVSGQPTTVATNFDVTTSQTYQTPNAVSSPIISTVEKVSLSSSTGHLSSTDKEGQAKATTREREVNLTETNNSSSSTTASNSNDVSAPVKEKSVEPTNSTSRNVSLPKHKSVSPGPKLGAQNDDKNGDNDDDASSMGRPPSPKKRRWSAPDQIEAESQQRNLTGDDSQSLSSKRTDIATESTSSRTSSFSPTNASTSTSNDPGDKGNREVGSNGGNSENRTESKEMCGDNSEEHKSPNTPTEKV